MTTCSLITQTSRKPRGIVARVKRAQLISGVWTVVVALAFCRYVLGKDPVPLLPPGGDIGFVHVGRQVRLHGHTAAG